MKKLDKAIGWLITGIIIYIVIWALFSLTGCKKCETCRTDITTMVKDQYGRQVGNTTNSYTTFDACGTRKEIQAIEGEVTSTYTQGNAGNLILTATVHTKTSCR